MKIFKPHAPASKPSAPSQGIDKLDTLDLPALLERLSAGNWIQRKVQEKLSPENRTVDSVAQFTEMFPPDLFEDALSKIREILLEIGLPDSEKLTFLSEYLFADIFIGRPEINPAYL